MSEASARCIYVCPEVGVHRNQVVEPIGREYDRTLIGAFWLCEKHYHFERSQGRSPDAIDPSRVEWTEE